jgi:para-nitrobenzyl esterase
VSPINPARLSRSFHSACRLFTLGLLGAASAVLAAAPVVHTESGDLEGRIKGDVAAYLGIPYAAPPVGALRWRAPRPAASWSGLRAAQDFGYSCVQPAIPEHTLPGAAQQMSEDCLTLNVWAHTSASGAPVMVWIYGGGDVSGTSANRFYDGTAFAHDGVVLVSLNYRLGNLGFFAHPALRHENVGVGANFGLQDQLAALAWVQRNIAAFGGDPKNVTVFGESAGALDILALMTTPAARGLFHKAIVESAGVWTHWPRLTEAEAAGIAVAKQLNVEGPKVTAAQLRALPAQQLVQQNAMPGLLPVIDGVLLRDEPLGVFARGEALAIPLLIGSNNEEGSLLGEAGAQEQPQDRAPEPAGLRALYGESADDDAAFARLIFRDQHFAAPARSIAAQHSAHAPTFLYRFEYVMAALRGRRSGAHHASEIPFVFATVPQIRLTEADTVMIEAMHDCWIAFAKTGTPGCPHVPAWPAHTPAQDVLMRFADEISMQPTPDATVLDALQNELTEPKGTKR